MILDQLVKLTDNFLKQANKSEELIKYAISRMELVTLLNNPSKTFGIISAYGRTSKRPNKRIHSYIVPELEGLGLTYHEIRGQWFDKPKFWPPEERARVEKRIDKEEARAEKARLRRERLLSELSPQEAEAYEYHRVPNIPVTPRPDYEDDLKEGDEPRVQEIQKREKSILIPDIDPQDLFVLGRLFKQDAVIYKSEDGIIGMYYLQEPKAQVAVDINANPSYKIMLDKAIGTSDPGVDYEAGEKLLSEESPFLEELESVKMTKKEREEGKLWSKTRGMSFTFNFLWDDNIPWDGNRPFNKEQILKLIKAGKLKPTS